MQYLMQIINKEQKALEKTIKIENKHVAEANA